MDDRTANVVCSNLNEIANACLPTKRNGQDDENHGAVYIVVVEAPEDSIEDG